MSQVAPPAQDESLPEGSPLEETHMGRRRFLQASAAAGAAALAIGHDDSPLVGDAEAAIPAVAFVPVAATVVGMSAGTVLASSVAEWTGDESDNEIILYHQAQSLKESMSEIHDTILGNYLEDMQSMASIHARSALADEYEAGGDAQACHDAAVDAVWDYYDNLYSNEVHSGIYALAELGVIDNSSASDFWVDLVAPSDYSGDVDGEITTTITSEMQSADVDLASGYTERVEAPEIHIEVPLADGGTDTYEGVPIQEWINNYDAEAGPEGETSIETDNGATIQGDWDANVPNVTREDDDDLPSDTVFRTVVDWLSALDAIEDQAATVVANYDETFTQNLYQHLEDGDITPDQIRGIEGRALYMSGTDDVHDSRFQMALASMLGVEGVDLSSSAHMTVEYTGFTGENRPEGAQTIHPKDWVSEEVYEGLLFGRGVPDIVPGTRIAMDPIVFAGDYGGEVHAIDSATGQSEWSYEGLTNRVHATAVSPDGTFAAVGDRDSNLHVVDVETGDRISAYGGHADQIRGLTVSPDSSVVYSASVDQEVHALDAESGAGEWTYTGHTDEVRDVAVSPDGETVYSMGFDGELHAIDASTGEQIWAASPHSSGFAVTVSYDGDVLFTGGAGSMYALDASDGGTLWSYGGTSTVVWDVAPHPNGSMVFAADDDGDIHGIDRESGTSAWVFTGHSNAVEGLASSPDGSMVFTASDDGTVRGLNTNTGDEEWSYSGVTGETPRGKSVHTMRPLEPCHGMVQNGFFFDAESGEERHLSNGVLEVESMQDQEGEEIALFDEDLITEIEETAGRSLEDIVADIDEIDGVSDVDDLTDLQLIINEVDGISSPNDLDSIDWQETDEPEYDSYDSEEYVQYIDEVAEDLEDSLADDDDGGGSGIGGIGWPDGGGGLPWPFSWFVDEFGWVGRILVLGLLGIGGYKLLDVLGD